MTDRWFLVASLFALAVAIAALILSRYRQRRAVADIEAGLRRLAEGDFGHKVYGGSFTSDLTLVFNAASEELAARIAALEDDRRQLRAVLSGMVEGVVCVDGSRRILYVNARAAQLLDFDATRAAGKRIWELVRDRRIQEVVAAALAADAPQRAEVEWKGPPPRSLALTAARLAGPSPAGAVVVLHDTTELRRLERVRQDFVANVSHELKTPLAVIKACTETLLDGAADDPDHRGEFLQQIDAQADRLHALILDLLSLARIESGGAQLTFESVDLGLEAADCLARQRARADAKGQRLDGIGPDGVAAWADAEAIGTVLDNLVDNAIKYTPAGGRVTVRWSVVGDDAVLDVEDTGVGIPERDQPHVFERFYRVDKARSRELGGTGLGLAIVKHLAESMRGSVAVRSQMGKGTTVSVRLPLRS